jgi:hypothetical protein
MRSDRLPSSTTKQNNCTCGFLLQQNSLLGIYKVEDTGVILQANTAGFVSTSTGLPDNDTPDNFTNQLIDSCNICSESRNLECYQFQNNQYVVNSGPCQQFNGKYIFQNGCYVLVTEPITSLAKDFISLNEWMSRVNIVFGACRNVWSHLFTNNWVNGVLYAFAFKNDRFFTNGSAIAGQPCLHTVELTNPTGNGWGSWTIDIEVNGLTFLNGLTLNSGTGPDTFSFYAYPGDTVTIKTNTPSSAPSGCQVLIKNQANGVIIPTTTLTLPQTIVNGTAFCTGPTPYFQAYSQFCKKTMYLDIRTNNFYYRSSPYDDLNQIFCGVPLLNGSTNDRNLLFPTTIVDLGPKTEFIQELVMSDNYDGYTMKNLNTTTFSDISDLLNILIISRLANTDLIAIILGGQGANIFSYFNERSRFNVDADYAQMISINSELGVNEFDSANYPDNPNPAIQDPVYFNSGSVNDTVIGVFFSSDTQLRDYVTPRRTIINQNLPIGQACFADIPVFSQKVPFYQWNIKPNMDNIDSIFGSQSNDWYTTPTIPQGSSYFTQRYQSLDRLYSTSRYFINTNTIAQYQKAHIYAVDNTGELTPSTSAWIQHSPTPRTVTVGAPFHFYFGLKKGGSAFDRFARQWLNFDEIEG